MVDEELSEVQLEERKKLVEEIEIIWSGNRRSLSKLFRLE